MNYGERQGRAIFLVQALRKRADQNSVIHDDYRGTKYTVKAVADAIEAQDDFGKSVVAMAGWVLQAMTATPEFFEKKV